MKRFVTCTAVIALAACSSERSGTFEGEGGTTGNYAVDEDDGAVTAEIRTEDGIATLRSGESVAPDLPDGFTVYPGAKVLSSTNFSQAGKKGAMVLLESEADPEAMAEFYRKQAESAGIEVRMEMSINDGKMIAGESDGGLTFSFNATPEDGKTNAQLMIGTNLGG